MKQRFIKHLSVLLLVAGFLSMVINFLVVQVLPLFGRIGNLDPKNYYRGWEPGNSPREWRPLPPPPPILWAKIP